MNKISRWPPSRGPTYSGTVSIGDLCNGKEIRMIMMVMIMMMKRKVKGK